MIRAYECTGPDATEKLPARSMADERNVDADVAKIISAVKSRGDDAVREYTLLFDKAEIASPEVSREEIDKAFECANPAFIEMLRRSYDNIFNFHEKQKRAGYVIADEPGIILGQRIIPVDTAGIYVPGGRASLTSTVLMNAVPAKIAGVGEVIMATPPGHDGEISGDILAAAKLAGVDRVFRVGGAQAIAAMAYGTRSIPKTDKIVGPGNIYVATAKRMVSGDVGIDMIAGPSEVMIIADDSANPDCVAMDMLSQAEHDPLAAAYLVTTSAPLAEKVAERIGTYLQKLPRKKIAEASIENNGAVIVTDTLENAAAICNKIAPEHLGLCVADPFALFPAIRHAASVFLGQYSPEALGDYFAGPNHTLPTGGAARFSSPLSVDDFLKKSSFVYYDKTALEASRGMIEAFAYSEGLDAHAGSVAARFGFAGEWEAVGNNRFGGKQ